MSRRERRAMRARHRRGRVMTAGAGAAAMFFLDPDRGRRRRALARDQVIHYRNVAVRSAQATSRDFENRMQGLRARSERAMAGGEWGSSSRPDFLQEHWSPTTRAVAGGTGGLFLLYGLARRGLRGLVFSGLGSGLIARAVTNMRVGRLTGMGAGGIDVSKSIEVEAPVERVFALWDDIERFPEFMTNVREVRRTGDNQSHWEVEGPAGSTVHWEAETTERDPNRMIAWRTSPGSAVSHSGSVRFEEVSGDRTRVTVRLTYNPVTGALGDMAATLLGSNPRKQLDEDLLRMKTLVETGSPAHDAARHEGSLSSKSG